MNVRQGNPAPGFTQLGEIGKQVLADLKQKGHIATMSEPDIQIHEEFTQVASFRHSASIAKLTEALAKAEGEFPEITKDCENPYFKSRYADLATLIKATRPSLSKWGLTLIQIPQVNGGAMVTSLLSHAGSGEWLASDLKMPITKQDAQGIGSAITYARRYAYQSILNIAAEDDDDGNAAVGHHPLDKERPSRPGKSTDADDGAINDVQLRAFDSACNTGGRTKAQVDSMLKELGLTNVSQFSKRDFNNLIRWALNTNPNATAVSDFNASLKIEKSKKKPNGNVEAMPAASTETAGD